MVGARKDRIGAIGYKKCLQFGIPLVLKTPNAVAKSFFSSLKKKSEKENL
jgi:hypothetical protein